MIAKSVERIGLIVAGAVLGAKFLSAAGLSWWVFGIALGLAAGAYVYGRFES